MAEKKSGCLGRVVRVIGLVLLLMVLLFVAGGLALDGSPKFERHVDIDADRAAIHPWIVDLRRWDDWGPWRDEDPDIQYTYTERTDQVDSRMEWTMSSGSGAVWFTAIDPQTGVEYKFQWEDRAISDGAIRYEPLGDGKTRVTWSFQADLGWNLIGRYVMFFARGTFESMFDDGLAKLKTKVEGGT